MALVCAILLESIPVRLQSNSRDCRHVNKMPRLSCHSLSCTPRDGESAYVSMNDKTCAIKENLIGATGTQLCGGWFKEEVFRVKGCYVTLSAASEGPVPLKVRVWTNLDGDARDESFGIDNILIAQHEGEGNA